MRNRFQTRAVMVYVYLFFMIAWFGGGILAYHYSNPDNLESLGFGTVCGVIIAVFKDMMNFMWRDSDNGEKSSKGNSERAED